MRFSKIMSGVTLLLLSSTLKAVAPVSGPYVSFLFGGSYEAPKNFNAPNPLLYLPKAPADTPATVPARVGFDTMINAGFEVGTRICENYRLGIEGLYNTSPYSFIRINNLTFHSPQSSTGWRINGGTWSGLGFINGYYDFISPDTQSDTVPYVGLGVGYAYIYNAVKFFYNNQPIYTSDGVNKLHFQHQSSAAAAQGIIGVSHYLDDFAWFSIDVRAYGTANTNFTTKAKTSYETQLKIISVNFLFSGAFDLA